MNGIHCFLASYKTRFHTNDFTKSMPTYTREVTSLETKQQPKDPVCFQKDSNFPFQKKGVLGCFKFIP